MSWIRQHSPAGTPPRARPGPGSPPSLPHPANHTRKSHGHQPKATERQRSSPAQVAANQAAAAIGTRVKPDLGRRRRARRERGGCLDRARPPGRRGSRVTRRGIRLGVRRVDRVFGLRLLIGGRGQVVHATRGVGNWESVGATGPEVGTGERRAARARDLLAGARGRKRGGARRPIGALLMPPPADC